MIKPRIIHSSDEFLKRPLNWVVIEIVWQPYIFLEDVINRVTGELLHREHVSFRRRCNVIGVRYPDTCVGVFVRKGCDICLIRAFCEQVILKIEWNAYKHFKYGTATLF